MTQKFYKSFDCHLRLDIRGTLSDIFKAFYKAWYEGLIFKLRTYGINGKLFNLMQAYLHS